MSIPFNITTGKGTTLTREVDSNSVLYLSSYTGMPVKLSVDVDNLPSSYKKEFIVFEINNKFLLKGNNVEFNFPIPGVYKITLYNADQNGERVESFTTYLTSFNYITDTIVPQSQVSTITNNIVSNSANNPNLCLNPYRTISNTGLWFASSYNTYPVHLIRYNTWQLCSSLSAIDYNINLYCDRSKSVDYLKEKNYYTKNLLNYPIWQFTTDGRLPNGGQRPTFINTLSTTSENIYLTYDGITGFVSTTSGANSIFCGTSGSNYFYFKDDSINYSSDILYFTQNLKDIPLTNYLIDNKTVQAFSQNLPITNTSSATLSAIITQNFPYSIGFSYNGLVDNFPTSIFNGTEYPVFIGIKDIFGNFLKYYPKLTLVSNSDPLTANTVKVVLLSAGNSPSGAPNVYLPQDLSTSQISFSTYNLDSVDVDTLSSFAVTTLSADFDPDFNFSGFFNNITISADYLTTSRNFTFNPGILSATSVISVNGVTSNIGGLNILNYYPNNTVYNINKINEDFDYTGTLKSYAFMPSLINQTNLFDYFFTYIAGDENSSPNEFGKRVYEKTANFVSNTVDLDVSNVSELYSLYDEIGYVSKNYDLLFPSNLQRYIDLLSISYNKLIGVDTGYNQNYSSDGNNDSVYRQTNLGNQLTNSSIISAGQNIVIYQYFKKKYYTITPTIVPISTDLLSAYANNNPNALDPTFGGLSAYPLSGYQNNWNWGLPTDVQWEEHTDQNEFYLQTPTDVTSLNKLESVVDWDNFLTTLSSLQHNEDLYTLFNENGGLAEQYFENELRKGVGLL